MMEEVTDFLDDEAAPMGQELRVAIRGVVEKYQRRGTAPGEQESQCLAALLRECDNYRPLILNFDAFLEIIAELANEAPNSPLKTDILEALGRHKALASEHARMALLKNGPAYLFGPVEAGELAGYVQETQALDEDERQRRHAARSELFAHAKTLLSTKPASSHVIADTSPLALPRAFQLLEQALRQYCMASCCVDASFLDDYRFFEKARTQLLSLMGIHSRQAANAKQPGTQVLSPKQSMHLAVLAARFTNVMKWLSNLARYTRSAIKDDKGPKPAALRAHMRRLADYRLWSTALKAARTKLLAKAEDLSLSHRQLCTYLYNTVCKLTQEGYAKSSFVDKLWCILRDALKTHLINLEDIRAASHTIELELYQMQAEVFEPFSMHLSTTFNPQQSYLVLASQICEANSVAKIGASQERELLSRWVSPRILNLVTYLSMVYHVLYATSTPMRVPKVTLTNIIGYINQLVFYRHGDSAGVPVPAELEINECVKLIMTSTKEGLDEPGLGCSQSTFEDDICKLYTSPAKHPLLPRGTCDIAHNPCSQAAKFGERVNIANLSPAVFFAEGLPQPSLKARLDTDVLAKATGRLQRKVGRILAREVPRRLGQKKASLREALDQYDNFSSFLEHMFNLMRSYPQDTTTFTTELWQFMDYVVGLALNLIPHYERQQTRAEKALQQMQQGVEYIQSTWGTQGQQGDSATTWVGLASVRGTQQTHVQAIKGKRSEQIDREYWIPKILCKRAAWLVRYCNTLYYAVNNCLELAVARSSLDQLVYTVCAIMVCKGGARKALAELPAEIYRDKFVRDILDFDAKGRDWDEHPSKRLDTGKFSAIVRALYQAEYPRPFLPRGTIPIPSEANTDKPLKSLNPLPTIFSAQAKEIDAITAETQFHPR